MKTKKQLLVQVLKCIHLENEAEICSKLTEDGKEMAKYLHPDIIKAVDKISRLIINSKSSQGYKEGFYSGKDKRAEIIADIAGKYNLSRLKSAFVSLPPESELPISEKYIKWS